MTLLAKLLLMPFSALYSGITFLRNKMFDGGVISSVSFSIPVITVGNLSVGGTGKTPHIEYLIRLLKETYKIGTQSRGYRRRTKGFVLADENTTAREIGDEPHQFHLKFPEVVVSVCEQRMVGIPELLSLKPDTQVILLDDAYQHRTVRAGMNILITDFNKPFYEDHVLPLGRLREPRSGYQRAQIIVVSKCPKDLSVKEQEAIISKVKPLAHQSVFFTRVDYGQCYDFFSGTPVELFQNSSVLLLSGIAKPEPLVEYLSKHVRELSVKSYPDHHFFTPSDLEDIKSTLGQINSDDKIIITTEKDATRLQLHRELLSQWKVAILVLPIEVVFLGNQALFDQKVLQFVTATSGNN